MIRFYFSILLSLVLTGCSSDFPPMEETLEDNRNVSSPTISEALAKALDEASSLRNRLYGISSTRSYPEISIDPILTSSTRSESDTAYYIVNYGDNEGYAVVTTTEGFNKVWAISDEGSLHISDTTYNKGLAAFFNNLEVERLSATSTTSQIPDTTIHDFQPFIRNEGTEKVGPLLTKDVRNWHQDSPYNWWCPNYFTSTAPKVGCMALSAAQIMSYHEWPTQLWDIQIDWSKIKTGSNTLLSQILAKLGSSEYFNLCYVDSLTYGYEYKSDGITNNVISTFEKIGYKKLNSPKDFSEDIASIDLKSNGPLLIYSHNTPSVYSGMHAWVIDGFINDYYEEYVTSYDGTPNQWIKRNSYLLHCIWGYQDHGDGYFRWHTNYIGGEEREKWEVFEDRKGPGLKQYRVHYYTGFKKAQ